MAGPNLIADLRASLTWDLSDFQRGTRSIEAGLNNIVNLAGRMADAVANAGKRMTVGLTLPMAGIATLVTKAASDAAELQSAYDFTFGRMLARMNLWAEETGNAMGRATQEMQQGALAFGQLFKAAAPNEEAAARLSQQFTELAQDASSFFNTDFDTAMGKIRSGLTGEAEPLRDFGVFLSEAAVNAKALEMNLITSGQELNEQGKIMARAALIAEGLSAAQGDIARTSDSLANRFRSLVSDMRELAVELGERLEPYARALVATGQRVVAWVKNLPDGVKNAAVAIGIFVAALGPLTFALSTLAVFTVPLLLLRFASFATLGGRLLFAMSAILNPIGTLVIAGGKLATSFGGVTAILSRLLPFFLRLAGPVGAVIALFQIFGRDIANGVQRWADAIREAVGPQVQQLFAAMTDLVDGLRESFRLLADSEIGQFFAEVRDWIGALIGDFLEMWGVINGVVLSGIVQAVTGIVRVIGDGIDAVNSILKNGWEAGWEGAVQAVGRAIMRIGQWIYNIWPALGALVMLLGKLTGAKFEVPEKAPSIGGSGNGAPKPAGGGVAVSGGNYALAKEDKARSDGRTRSRGPTGPTAEELAERRELLELDHDIAVARERGDEDGLRALERRRDMLRTIEQYENAGLSTDEARVAAKNDMAELDQARAEAQARAQASDQRSLDMQLARIREDYAHLQMLENEEYLEDRIAALQRDGLSLANAEAEAAKNLAALEEARADAIERRLADQRAAHQIELAELRGDRTMADRLREQERVRARALDLQQYENLSPADAMEQAQREAADRSRAYLQGSFRDAFRGGLYAAMNGNFWDWFRDRMRESSFNALAKVLDRLADSLANMVSGNSGGGGIAGFLGSLFNIGASALGGGMNNSLFGGGGSGGGGGGRAGHNSGGGGGMNNSLTGSAGGGSIHGFASGGSFRIRGFAGIDQNMLSLNGTPVARVSQNEIFDVRKGERPQAMPAPINFDLRGAVMTEQLLRQMQGMADRARDEGAARGAADGVKAAIDLQKRTFGAALSGAT